MYLPTGRFAADTALLARLYCVQRLSCLPLVAISATNLPHAADNQSTHTLDCHRTQDTQHARATPQQLIVSTNAPTYKKKKNRLTARVAELGEENKALSEAYGRRLGQGGGEGGNTGSGGGEGGSAGLAEDPAAPFVVPGDRRDRKMRLIVLSDQNIVSGG